MRYCFSLCLFVSVALADERFATRLGSQAVDVIGGVQHTGAGTDPVGGMKIRGGLGRFVSGYGEFAYSRTRNDVLLFRGNNGELQSSLIDLNGGLELHGSGLRLAPFAFSGIGLVRAGSSAELLGQKSEGAVNKLAGSFGGGLRFFVNRHWGFSAEAKAMKPMDLKWIQRYAVGIFLSFSSD